MFSFCCQRKKNFDKNSEDTDSIQIDRTRLVEKEIIGSGFFGTVSKALLKPSTTNNDRSDENQEMGQLVAMKTVKHTKPDNMSDQDWEKEENELEKCLLNEARLMAGFDAYHVVKLIGVCVDYHPYLIVMEFMENGNLLTYLKNKTKIVTRSIIQISLEIADGMLYLEHKNLVHRDLAARNCLMSSDFTVKISDFGLSKTLKDSNYYTAQTDFAKPVRHMAPESLSVGHFSSSSDVFSYGIVLWEIATNGETPYSVKQSKIMKYFDINF